MIRPGRFLAGCAIGAILGAAPSGAVAQSYLGGGSVVAGDASILHTPGAPGVPATTQIMVAQPETVIEWRPVDTLSSGAIDFQPAGTTATFQAAAGVADYTVLNRILPIDATDVPIASTVAFRGTTAALLVNDPGGHIWFYSPTGIIAGPTASFNVGSLILTTNDIGFVAGNPGGSPPTPGSIYGAGGLVQFSGPAGSTGLVDVQPGAQISATGANAYVALVAPRVHQRGTVQANGQIAYIAAEQLDLTINGGLFDFAITVGTEDNQGVVHSGTTTGPASTGLADGQRISIVALPKNDALTMLLSGSIGYAPAASAFDDGSAIVLAAGFPNATPSGLPASELGNIEIGNSSFANPVTGYATNNISISPSAGTIAFSGNAAFFAPDSIFVAVDSGEQISATNFLQLNAGRPGAGGTIDIRASNGGVIEAGVLSLNAPSTALSSIAGFGGLDATGGTIDIVSDGGDIRGGSLFADVVAQGGSDPSLGGLANGGTIDLSVLSGGTVQFAAMEANAAGIGGESALQGGQGNGGSISISDLGGNLALGSVVLRAAGYGGGSPVASGDGLGGHVEISIANQNQSWDSLSVFAGAGPGRMGQDNLSTGSATGQIDAIDLSITGPGSLQVNGGVQLDASVQMATGGLAGFTGQAGGVSVLVEGSGSLTVGGTLGVSANAIFAVEGLGDGPIRSPVQRGGTVSVIVDGGNISADGLELAAYAQASSGTMTSGEARGGTAELIVRNGGSVLIDDESGAASAGIFATASGVIAPVAADAFGGTARLVVEDGSFEVLGSLSVLAAAGGPGSAGAGDGLTTTGGLAQVELQAGRIELTGLSIGASGDPRIMPDFGSPPPGGVPIVGAGSIGIGGEAGLVITGGQFSGGDVVIEADGFGGASNASALGGQGTGGAAFFQLNSPSGGPHSLGDLRLSASGYGAPGTTGSTPGAAGYVQLATSIPLVLGGDLIALSLGDQAAAGAGIEVAVSGLPLMAGGDITLNTTRSVVVTGLVANGTVSVVGTNGITAERLASVGTTLLRADNGAVLVSADLASTGPVTALGRSLDLTSLGSLTFAGLDATAGDATIRTAGNLTANNLIANGTIDLDVGGSLALANLNATAGSATVRTGGNATAANLSASTAIDLDIGGAFNLSGTARGTAITVRSSDIVLGSAARIGARGVTQTVGLINRNPANAMVIGDGIETPGYRLGAGEAASLFADQSIRIGSTGNIALGDLALSFGAAGNIGTGGVLEISTPARVSIGGDLALTTTGADDTLLIDPTLIELDTLAGSIAMLNDSGNPLGKLVMVGGTIAIATRPTLDQLASAPSLAAINALLNQPGGTPRPLLAGTISLTVADGLYIQNTGATGLYRDRRGFGASALAIQTGSPATRIAINGIIQAAGGPVTGLDTQQLVTINGAPAAAGGNFDPASTINGCAIGAACAPPEGTNPPSSEDLDTPLDPGEPPATLFVGPLIELAATDPLIDPPLVDEPITGVGNDDLWQPRCNDDGDETCPEEGSTP